MWLLWTSIAGAECPRLEPLLENIDALVVDGLLEQASDGLKEAEAALECQRANPGVLARYWLIEGAFALYSGDEEWAGDAFSAARRVQPELAPRGLGAEVLEAWGRSRQPTERVSLSVLPKDPRLVSWLDGGPSTGEGAPGLHHIQVLQSGEVVFSEFLMAPAGATVLVETGLVLPEVAPDPEPASAVEPAPTTAEKKHEKQRWLLPVGLGAVAAGTGLFVANRVVVGRFSSIEGGPDASKRIDANYRAQAVTGVGAYTLWGLGGVGVTASFLL